MYKYDQDKYYRHRRWEEDEDDCWEREWRNRRRTYNQPYVPQMTSKDVAWTIGLAVCAGMIEGYSPYLTQRITGLLWPNRNRYNDYPCMAEMRVPELTEEVVLKRSYRVCDHSYPVGSHPRRLPKGQKASPQKIAEALELGIHLEEGWTWVKAFTKGETKQ